MMILAIDTATQYAGLALLSDDGLLAEEVWQANRNHTIELMPRIQRILKGSKISVTDLTGLGVSVGPGSFTGLRIGIAAAKGLALPYRVPTVGVPTLDIAAYPFRERGLPVWAVAQAGRNRIIVACYALVDEVWQVITEPEITNFEQFAAKIRKKALCTGEIDHANVVMLAQKTRNRAIIVPPIERIRRPGYLAEIAAQRVESNQTDDDLAPIYLSSL